MPLCQQGLLHGTVGGLHDCRLICSSVGAPMFWGCISLGPKEVGGGGGGGRGGTCRLHRDAVMVQGSLQRCWCSGAQCMH